MTIKEALKSTINYPLPDLTLDKALIDADIDGTADYTKADTKGVDLCAAGLLFTLLTSADIKEGDYSLTLPSRNTLLLIYSALVKKWGQPDLLVPKPTVKGLSVW